TGGGPEDVPVFVVAHGFTGDVDRPHLRRVARALTRHGAVLTFSFRGHGASGGRSTVGDREVLDLAAAVGRARELGHTRVVTVGFSMGGSVVLRHAALGSGAPGEALPGAAGPDAAAAVRAAARRRAPGAGRRRSAGPGNWGTRAWCPSASPWAARWSCGTPPWGAGRRGRPSRVPPVPTRWCR